MFFKIGISDILQCLQENTCATVSFLIKLQALAQVISCEFWEMSKNTFSTEYLQATASVYCGLVLPEVAVRRTSTVPRFWRILQISQEITFHGLFFS